MSGLRPLAPFQLTRDEFEAWLRRNRIQVYVYPYVVLPCTCGDYNCHGWRLVQQPRTSLAPMAAVSMTGGSV